MEGTGWKAGTKTASTAGSYTRTDSAAAPVSAAACATHLQALELADGRAELLALEEVGHGGVEGALCNAQHLRGNADAALVQNLNGDLIALADLADDILRLHSDQQNAKQQGT